MMYTVYIRSRLVATQSVEVRLQKVLGFRYHTQMYLKMNYHVSECMYN